MGTSTWPYGVASLTAAREAIGERLALSPMPAAQGTTVPFAASHAHPTTATKNVVDRKADDRVHPRGRRH